MGHFSKIEGMFLFVVVTALWELYRKKNQTPVFRQETDHAKF